MVLFSDENPISHDSTTIGMNLSRPSNPHLALIPFKRDITFSPQPQSYHTKVNKKETVGHTAWNVPAILVLRNQKSGCHPGRVDPTYAPNVICLKVMWNRYPFPRSYIRIAEILLKYSILGHVLNLAQAPKNHYA